MYIHVPCSDDLTHNTLHGQTFVTSPFKTMHFQIFCKNYYDEVNECIFTKKQIENSNIQLITKIIMLLVLKENAFKLDVQYQISRFPFTLMLTSPKK